jgi:acetolactate synthase-1/2/3 large subunit
MPRGISPIFYALPAAIGAKLARPEKPCLAICGDGGILPTISELSTIRKYNIPLVILVFNNNSFGILEDYMRATYSLEGIMDLENPDFVRIASAFGIKAKRVKTLRQLRKTLRDSVRWDEPFLLEFSGPVFPPPWRT